jgi:hypothetical protein
MNGFLSVENRHARRRASEIDISVNLPRQWGQQAFSRHGWVGGGEAQG